MLLGDVESVTTFEVACGMFDSTKQILREEKL